MVKRILRLIAILNFPGLWCNHFIKLKDCCKNQILKRGAILLSFGSILEYFDLNLTPHEGNLMMRESLFWLLNWSSSSIRLDFWRFWIKIVKEIKIPVVLTEFEHSTNQSQQVFAWPWTVISGLFFRIQSLHQLVDSALF